MVENSELINFTDPDSVDNEILTDEKKAQIIAEAEIHLIRLEAVLRNEHVKNSFDPFTIQQIIQNTLIIVAIVFLLYVAFFRESGFYRSDFSIIYILSAASFLIFLVFFTFRSFFQYREMHKNETENEMIYRAKLYRDRIEILLSRQKND